MSEHQNNTQYAGTYQNYPYPYMPQPTQPYYPPYNQYMQMPQQQQQTTSSIPGMLPVEESYIENILRLNKGEKATVYMTFENNTQWNAKVFKGVIEAAGRDHVILSDPDTGKRYLLLMIYLDYITFDEELNYEYPYAEAEQNQVSYPPR